MEHISLSELRVGNIHEVPPYDNPRLNIYSNRVDGKSYSRITGYGISLVEQGILKPTPILITEEWLIAFGFKKHEEQGRYGYRYYISSGVDYNYVIERDFRKEISHFFGVETTDAPNSFEDYKPYWFAYEIKYIHQLQNLIFSITNEELTLNIES